jgi:phosphatidylserine/phosphatidylglycerophosphate/cardiolipin synthase-like enzyme
MPALTQRNEMKSFCWLLALVLVSAPPSAAANEAVDCRVRTRFTGQGGLGEFVKQALRQTQSQVLLALYGFNNSELAEELSKLAGKGVSVGLKVDANKGARTKTSRMLDSLRAAGVRVETVAPEGRNHNKFAVIDRAKVLTGSYNWTLKAESNWENLLLLDCPELAEKYVKEWENIR